MSSKVNKDDTILEESFSTGSPTPIIVPAKKTDTVLTSAAEIAPDSVLSQANWLVPNHPDMGALIGLRQGHFTERVGITENFRAERILPNGKKIEIFMPEEFLKNAMGNKEITLYMMGLALFTANNHVRDGEKHTQITPTVHLPVKLYAVLCGHDVEEHHTKGESRIKREHEKQRVKEQYNLALREIRQALRGLFNQEFSDGDGRYSHIRVLSSYKIRNCEVTMTYTQEFVAIITGIRQLTYYPAQLAKVDDRRTTALLIAWGIAAYINLDANQKRLIKTGKIDEEGGPHFLLSVKTILGYAGVNIKSYETLGREQRHWRDKIKAPIETALEYLCSEEICFLKEYTYTYTKGEKLSAADLQALNTNERKGGMTYSRYSKLYIDFVPATPVDHRTRLAAKAEKAKKNRGRKNKINNKE